jgi:hypothetical protein
MSNEISDYPKLRCINCGLVQEVTPECVVCGHIHTPAKELETCDTCVHADLPQASDICKPCIMCETDNYIRRSS